MTTHRFLQAVPHRLLSAVLAMSVGAALTTPAVAHAALEPAAGGEEATPPEGEVDQERLQELFSSARTLYEEGQYEAAIAAFEAAYKVSPEPNLLYNIFVCYDRLGQPEQALEALDRYAEVAPPEDEDQIAKDRRRLEADLERKEAQPDDGGGTPDGTSGDSGSGNVDRGPQERIYGPAAWALTAVTGIALGVGIGFGVSSNNLANDAQDQCAPGASGQVCPRSASDDMDKARNRGIVADVSFAVAGVAAIALIAVIATKAAKRKRSSSARLSPYGGPQGAGLQFRTRF